MYQLYTVIKASQFRAQHEKADFPIAYDF